MNNSQMTYIKVDRFKLLYKGKEKKLEEGNDTERKGSIEAVSGWEK